MLHRNFIGGEWLEGASVTRNVNPSDTRDVVGEYAQAEPVLRKAADLAANDAMIQYHLGITYYRLGQKDQAATWLRRSLQNGANLAEAPRIRDLLKELGG